LAPYLFEVDASLFVGESGRLGARLDAEYEYMLSQKLILSPEVEIKLLLLVHHRCQNKQLKITH
jgi:copper resistance protein B